MDATYLQTQIDAAKTALSAYTAAELALATSNIQSYTIDTGQDRQTVTRADLSEIRKSIDVLMNRIATWQARLNGSGTFIGRPGW